MNNESERRMKLKILLHPAEEGGFWAEAPALPGCVSEGETLEETLTNIREAAEGWLEVAAQRIEIDDHCCCCCSYCSPQPTGSRIQNPI